MNKLITEFVGTFFLVLTICTAAVFGTGGDFAPFAIGGVLIAMIYAGGHISGAHYNPAVTLAATLRGRCKPVDAIAYIIVQILAGAAAAYLAKHFFQHGLKISELPFEKEDINAIIAAEALFTFALVYVVLNSATAKGTSGNSFYGIAIGSTVVVGAITVGSISGGVFNPAVAVGLACVKKLSLVHLPPTLAPNS